MENFKQKQLLLQLLDKFVEVCVQNNLKYYLAYGTVLGTIRHKGIIPWDDDIDIQMPREDYLKLQQLPRIVFGDKFQLSTWSETPNYPYDFLKLENLSTTLIERITDNIYIGGIYIDIFPLDGLASDNIEQQIQKVKIDDIVNTYIQLYLKNYSECESIYHFIKLKIDRYKMPLNKLISKWEKEASKNPFQKSEFVTDFHNLYYHKPMLRRTFGDGIRMEFEGRFYCIPEDHHVYLTTLYGNYMEFPPIEKRNSGHTYWYVNLEKRLTGEELNLIVKKIKKEKAYCTTLKKELKYVVKKMKSQLS